MSFKTTYGLAIALLVVVLIFYVAGRRERGEVQENANVSTVAAGVEKPLIPEDFGDAVKIVCTIKDRPRWVFEAEDPEDPTGSSWTMSEPVEADVQDWQVRDIASKIKRMKYAITYTPGQPGAVTAAEAGLDPPAAVVELANKEGKTVTVRLGRDISASAGYVQLDEGGDIYQVNTALKRILKDNVSEYRNLQLTDFTADRVVALEIVSRTKGAEPTTYRLVKRGTTWVFESPFRGNAVDSKIREVISALGRLYASKWIADAAKDPGAYGLDTPKLMVCATIEETVEPEKPEEQEAAADNDNAAEPPPEPEIKTVVHTVRISSLSPIGDKDKVYIQKEGDTSVATIPKTTVDKFQPEPDEWRDLRVTTADVTAATRIEIATADETGALERQGDRWQFAADHASADATEIRNLLNRIKNLKARSFVEGVTADPGQFGLDQPQVTLTLTLPGDGGTERLTVGGFADPRTQRLVCVRRGDSDSVAKVLVNDAKPLLRGLADYRDRQVFDFPPDRIERVEIDRPDPVSGGRFALALARQDGEWKMADPVEADCEAQAAKTLGKDLARLRASEVAAVKGDPAAYGLDEPAITVRLTYQPPEITKFVEVKPEPEPTTQPATPTTQPAAPATQPAEPTTQPAQPKFKEERIQPPPETYELALVIHDGTVYAKRGDSDVIYSLDKKLYDALGKEYHTKTTFDFQQSKATAVKVKTADGEEGFLKEDGQWKYAPEPDIPIDTKKVENLLVRIGDLKVERYVEYGAPDLSAYGLDDPSHTLTLRTDDKQTVLLVSDKVCDAVPGKHHYAVLDGSNDVFLISPSTIRRFTISLDDYEAK